MLSLLDLITIHNEVNLLVVLRYDDSIHLLPNFPQLLHTHHLLLFILPDSIH